MNLTFSGHILERCLERRISIQRVFHTLTQGVAVRGDGTKEGERFVMAHGRIRVAAMLRGKTCYVLSAWRARYACKIGKAQRPGKPTARLWRR